MRKLRHRETHPRAQLHTGQLQSQGSGSDPWPPNYAFWIMSRMHIGQDERSRASLCWGSSHPLTYHPHSAPVLLQGLPQGRSWSSQLWRLRITASEGVLLAGGPGTPTGCGIPLWLQWTAVFFQSKPPAHPFILSRWTVPSADKDAAWNRKGVSTFLQTLTNSPGVQVQVGSHLRIVVVV